MGQNLCHHIGSTADSFCAGCESRGFRAVPNDDVPLTVRKMFEDGTDWWRIERQEPDGLEREPGYDYPRWVLGQRTMSVEGTGREMLDLAWAIEHQSEDSHKRCAVEWTEAGVKIWSPRNSNNDIPTVPHARAVALAQEIRVKIAA